MRFYFSLGYTRSLVVLLTFTIAALTACGPIAGDLQELPDDQTSEGDELVPAPSGDVSEKLGRFIPEEIAEENIEQVALKYAYVDTNKAIPDNLRKKALAYYEANKTHLDNTRYLSVIDFSKHSRERRFFVINMSSGAVWALPTAHGKGSDGDNDGYASSFSNKSGSLSSSLGHYRTAETYSGKHGFSLRLDGLSSSNSNARSRAVVIHGANYVVDSAVKQGRSWGCPAVPMDYRTDLINMIKGGSLIYAGLSAAK